MNITSNPASSRSFRIVCSAEQIPLVESLLQAEGYRFAPEPFSPFCRILLAEPRPLGSSLAAFFGYIYIQDRSAMLPPLALAPELGGTVLDMCASPGGKSGFLAQLAGPAGFILANEPNSARLATLRTNLQLLNLVNVGTCSWPGEKIPLAPATWPYILLDPPCSGWGTVNKNPQAVKMWQGHKLDRLIGLQRTLLRHAERLLEPGGLLLYSTCTTNFDENEAQTIFAENELGLERINLLPFPGFTFEQRQGGEGCLLVDGKASGAQGFYISLLRKPGKKAARTCESEENEPGDCAVRIDVEGCLSTKMPAGTARIFNGKVRFIPDRAKILPAGFTWQAALLGKCGAGDVFSPEARMRLLAPPPDSENSCALVLERVEDMQDILAGKSFQSGLRGKRAALWWRDLPLGFVSLKKGRVIASFK